MRETKDYLALDPGHAFGVNYEENASNYDCDFNYVNQYDWPNEDMSSYKCLIINCHVDQEFLYKEKDRIRRFLDDKKIVIFSGNLYRDWLPGGSRFIPKKVTSHFDYQVSIVKPHPVFAGVESDDLTYSRGVAGFFARGHHPLPEGAEVLLTLPGDVPILYVDRKSTKGTILVHAGNDIFGSLRNPKISHAPGQLKQWIQDEYTRLQKDGAQR